MWGGGATACLKLVSNLELNEPVSELYKNPPEVLLGVFGNFSVWQLGSS